MLVVVPLHEQFGKLEVKLGFVGQATVPNFIS